MRLRYHTEVAPMHCDERRNALSDHEGRVREILAIYIVYFVILTAYTYNSEEVWNNYSTQGPPLDETGLLPSCYPLAHDIGVDCRSILDTWCHLTSIRCLENDRPTATAAVSHSEERLYDFQYLCHCKMAKLTRSLIVGFLAGSCSDFESLSNHSSRDTFSNPRPADCNAVSNSSQLVVVSGLTI